MRCLHVGSGRVAIGTVMATRKSFLLRLDPALHDALQRWAGDELRSMNAQVEFILRDALKKQGRLKSGGDSDDRPGDSTDD